MGIKMYTNELGYLTNLAAMTIYGTKSLVFFSRINKPMTLRDGT